MVASAINKLTKFLCIRVESVVIYVVAGLMRTRGCLACKIT